MPSAETLVCFWKHCDLRTLFTWLMRIKCIAISRLEIASEGFSSFNEARHLRLFCGLPASKHLAVHAKSCPKRKSCSSLLNNSCEARRDAVIRRGRVDWPIFARRDSDARRKWSAASTRSAVSHTPSHPSYPSV